MEIKNCPVCGARGVLRAIQRGGYLAYVDCMTGGCLVGPNHERDEGAIAAWNRLSEAAALLGAVGRLEARLHEDWENNNLVLTILPTYRRAIVVNDERYPTLAAALVALAGEGNQ
jgi:hypothetical protein